MGFVRGYIPFFGWLVIKFQEVSWVKYLVFALAASTILFTS